MRRKGFTLIELMVVMAILAILAGIALPSLVGVKPIGQETQATGDTQNVQNAANRFNSDDIGKRWPEGDVIQKIEYVTGEYLILYIIKFRKEDPATGQIRVTEEIYGISYDALPPRLRNRINRGLMTQIAWDAQAEVRTDTGSIAVKFVPGYLDNTPKSHFLTRGVSLPLAPVTSVTVDGTSIELVTDKAPQYLWLLVKTNPGTPNEARRVETYRLTDAGDAYRLQAD